VAPVKPEEELKPNYSLVFEQLNEIIALNFQEIKG
jgi:hypothetical protein